jgi:predicted glycosyltransferase
MTREAALMGVPTVSVYAGRRAAIDVELERRGALRMGEPDGEIAPVSHRAASPRTQAELRERADTVISEFLSAALG